jgi:hypothetical protein
LLLPVVELSHGSEEFQGHSKKSTNKYITMLLQILFFHPETLQKDERSRSNLRCITMEVWEQGMINSYDVL